MDFLNSYDDVEKKKRNFHSQKDKEGVLLHHFHAPNLVPLAFSIFLSPALKAIDLPFLPLYRNFFGNCTPLHNDPLYLPYFSFDVHTPPRDWKTLVSLHLFGTYLLLAYKHAIHIYKDLLWYHLIQDLLLIDVLKNYMDKFKLNHNNLMYTWEKRRST